MCEPTKLAVASFALTAAAIGADQHSQHQNRKATKKAANESYAATVNDLQARSAEEILAAALDTDQVGVQTDAARGAMGASAAEAGVVGKSIDLLLKDLDATEGATKQSIARNRDSRLQQIERQKEQAAVYRDNQIVSAAPANPYLGALQLGSAGVDLATTLSARKPKVKT